MPHFVLWLAASAVTVLWLAPAVLLAKISRKTSLKLVKQWCRIELKIFGIKVAVTDRNHGRYCSPPYLYVILNQTSLSETWIVNSLLPTDFKAFMNIEFALIPLIGWLLWALGGVVIVRQWPSQSRQGMDKAERLLRAGGNLYMSIEGKRSPDGRLQPYKKGPAVLAIASKATIVPIVIHGAREVWPFGEWRVKPGKLEVVFCETISADALGPKDRHELTDRLRSIAERELAGRSSF
jgi:1-acyl-sn-glycerol-3-phosphate acyltransferase